MGAFDNYKPPPAAPPQGGGAFSNYQPPPDASSGGIFSRTPAADQPASFSQPDASATAPLDPRTATTGDYLVRAHQLAGGLGQIGQTADDYGRAATNTFGIGDRFAATMDQLTGTGAPTTGQPGDLLSTERAKTAAARERLGPAGTVAASITGFGPFAAQGIGAGLGGGVLGSGAELATGGALAGAGNSNADLLSAGAGKDALTGGAIGGVAGLGQGAAGKYVLKPIVNAVANKVGSATLKAPADITATAKSAKEDAYNALKAVPADVSDAAANARSAVEDYDPGGSLQANAPRTMAVLNRIDKSLKPGADQDLTGQDAMDYLVNQRTSMAPDDYRDAMNDLVTTGKVTVPGSSKPTTAYDLRTWLDQLRDVQGPTAGAENELAPIVEQHLNDAVDAGGGRGLFDQAIAANKVYKNAQFLQQGGEGVKYFSQSPGGEAARIAQTYYPTGAADLGAGLPTPAAAAYKRLSDIAMAGGGGMSSYGAMHAMAPVVDAATAGLGGLVGGPAGAVIGEHAGNLVNYGLLKPGAGAALGAMSKAATQRAINAAYPDLTGQSVKFPAMNLSPALRAIIFGTAAPSIK